MFARISLTWRSIQKIIIRDLSFLTWYIDWLRIDRTLNGKIFTFLSNFKFNPIAEHSRSAFSILYLAIQSIRIDPKNNTQRNEEENMKKMFVMCSAHNVLFIGGIFLAFLGAQMRIWRYWELMWNLWMGGFVKFEVKMG